MERFNVCFDAAALEDIRENVRYILKNLHEAGTAERVKERIYRECASLETLPNRYPLVRDSVLAEFGFRMTSAGKYLIFYTVDASRKSVNIKRIIHGKRDWQSLLQNPQ